MPTQVLKEFVEERLRAADPDVDLTEGSPYSIQVVDPIVARFAPDPFAMDIEKFIQARLDQEFPENNYREGSAVYDLLVKASQILMDPLSREVQLIRQGQSLARPDILAAEEADSLVANLFVRRSTGSLATGTVRLYFNAPVSITLTAANSCYTASGLNFLPTTLQSISAEAMIFNQSGSLYYFDIKVTAEQAGTEYNVDKEAVVGITNVNTAVLVKNLERFEGGLEEETTEELVERAETSVTDRSLVVARGVSARLKDQFLDLVHLQIVGMLDEEMNRDILTGGDLGESLLSGVDGYTEDDGDGDEMTYSFKIRYGDFTTLFGASGVLANKYYIVFSGAFYGNDASVPITNLDHIISNAARFLPEDVGGMWICTKSTNGANFGLSKIIARSSNSEIRIDKVGVVETGMSWMLLRKSRSIEIDSIVSPTELLLKEKIPIDWNLLVWEIRQKKLTVSDIPGGVVYTDLRDTLTINSNEIHIGGATDFYVRGTGVESKFVVVPAVSDEIAPAKGFNLIFEKAGTSYAEFVYAPDVDFAGLGVRRGHVLLILSGVNAGTYNILRVGIKAPGGGGESANYLQIDVSLTSNDPEMRYIVVDSIDINLIEPRDMRSEGNDLQTSQLSQSVTTSSALDFTSIGGEVGDILEIIGGNDKGKYTITAISGTGNKILSLAGIMKSTSSGLGWKLYKSHSGIELPLVRVSSVDLLDSSQQPTGYTIPYAKAVDARSTAFSNAGKGEKLNVTDAITGIVASTDLASLLPLPTPTILNIRVNKDTAIPVTLSGLTSKTAILNTINAAIPNIASVTTIDGLDYLSLRSGDRWLRVEESPMNANVGLDTSVEDNRRIRSRSGLNWSSSAYDVRPIRDVLYIRTGENVGYYYIILIHTDYVLAVGFDENGRVKFLQPETDVFLTIGSRSYGKARIYFPEPTSCQMRGSWHPPLKNTTSYPANFAVTENGDIPISEDEKARTYAYVNVNGATLRFFPDPDLSYSILPTSEDSPPNNLTTFGSNIVTSEANPSGNTGKNSRDSAIDFLKREIQVGDAINITCQPIQGNRDIRVWDGGVGINYPADLVTKTLIISLGDNPARTTVFSDQLTGPDSVVEEINRSVGETIAFIETIGSEKYLRLESDLLIVVHRNSTSLSIFWTSAPSTNLYNTANGWVEGGYKVLYVGVSSDVSEHFKLELDGEPSAGQAQHFEIRRPGLQRLHATLMNENVENGLYYMDVEFVSEGVGNQWNIGEKERMTLEGYEADGYCLNVVDPNYSYSMSEEVWMTLSRKLLTVGQSDRMDVATQLSGQNIQVNYDRSPLVSSIQSFASSELERVLDCSILVRHLQPHYINFELTYRGGSLESVVQQDVEEYLNEVGPNDSVESSILVSIPQKRGATSVQSPVELVAVVHDEERNISIERSENFVTHGRLATFFEGAVSITRETPSSL